MFTSLLLQRHRNKDQSVLENINYDLSDPKTWTKQLGSEKTEAGVRVTPEVALSQPAMWRGINILSFGAAKVPFDVFKRKPDGTKERDKTHVASNLIRNKANPYMTAFRFKMLMTFHMIFRGNGIAVIERDNGARPTALLPADPTRFGIVIVKNGDVKYLIGAGKEARLLDYYNVLHVRGLSWDGHMGVDLFELMKEPMSLGVAARRFGTRFFGKGANAGGLLITPTGLSDKAVARIEKDFKKATTGLDKSFTTTLLEDGLKYQQTTIAPEQAQFLATRQFEVRELANIIGIQSHKIGDKDGQAYNSLEQENSSFIDDSMDPRLCALEDEYNDKLLTEEEKRNGTHVIEANRKAIKRVDTKTETEDINNQLNNGQITEDEARAIRNMPAYPNGQGRRFRIPSNITYTDLVGNTQTSKMKTEVANLALDRLQIMLEVEVAQLSKACGKKGNFIASVERLYAEHVAKFEKALTPVMRVAETLWEGLPSAGVLAMEWCEESKAAVIEAAGCSAAELPQQLADLAENGWKGRCQRMTEKLFGGKNDAEFQGD